jgi:hypothetical protein
VAPRRAAVDGVGADALPPDEHHVAVALDRIDEGECVTLPTPPRPLARDRGRRPALINPEADDDESGTPSAKGPARGGDAGDLVAAIHDAHD